MAYKSRFIILGLGRFGATLAQRLAADGHRVTGIDISEAAVRPLEEQLDEALVGDATDKEVLEATDLADADAVVIAMGDEPLRNIIAAMHVVELGATRIIARGTDAMHGRILRKLGNIDVILPEQDMGAYVAEALNSPLPLSRQNEPSDDESGDT